MTMSDAIQALRFLEKISKLYGGRYLNLWWGRYPNRTVDDWDAISLFLEGYAFAWQGASSDYPHASAQAIFDLRKSGVESNSA